VLDEGYLTHGRALNNTGISSKDRDMKGDGKKGQTNTLQDMRGNTGERAFVHYRG